MPFPFGATAGIDTLGYLEAVLTDSHSGVDLPAAIVVETVQGEGGVCVAPLPWLQRLRTICDRHGILLIVDDIQAGCGRTGPFFSFERAGIVPDIVTISKSISGYGLPMSLVLLRPELDVWEPADHTGTFRGNQLAFVAATAALEVFVDDRLEERTRWNAEHIADRLLSEVCPLDSRIEIRGAGMIWGVDIAALDPSGALAKTISRRCFDAGLIIERVGRNDTVLKILPPLVIERSDLDRGLDVLVAAIRAGL
ncbi:MAG: ectB, partial [Acidimicrobiales bacterium]|nr:ectB [Acidimicrobiales bacterium]